jgi:hypothetical protein
MAGQNKDRVPLPPNVEGMARKSNRLKFSVSYDLPQ